MAYDLITKPAADQSAAGFHFLCPFPKRNSDISLQFGKAMVAAEKTAKQAPNITEAFLPREWLGAEKEREEYEEQSDQRSPG